MTQTFDTVVGHTYEVTFGIGAGNNGTTIVNPTINATAVSGVFQLTNAGSTIVWQDFTFDFVAGSATTELGFFNGDTPGGGFKGGIDNVRVVDLGVAAAPTLQVSPATNMSSSGNQGGPFSPLSFDYQLSASSGSVDYSISGLPAWLDASSTSGTVSTSPTTITFTVNANANGLSSGSYNATISFANTTNGQGDQTRTAGLTVNSGGGGPSKVYVSGKGGTDGSVCTRAAPCASLNYALGVTDAGGTITVLDDGVFGPIVLNKPVSIVGVDPSSHFQIVADPAAQVGCVGAPPSGCGLPNNGYAIEIAAGVSDEVILTNLLASAGSAGAGALKFSSGGMMQLSEDVFRGNDIATGPIVALYPNNPGTTQAQVYFSHSDIGFNGNNANAGAIEVKPSGNTSLKLHFNHVEVHNASYGIRTDPRALGAFGHRHDGGGGRNLSFLYAAVNAFSTAGTGTTNAVFDAVRVLNAGVAIKANGPQSTVILTNSTISGNGTGVQVQNNGVVYTPQSNTIYGNGTDINGGLSSAPPQRGSIDDRNSMRLVISYVAAIARRH